MRGTIALSSNHSWWIDGSIRLAGLWIKNKESIRTWICIDSLEVGRMNRFRLCLFEEAKPIRWSNGMQCGRWRLKRLQNNELCDESYCSSRFWEKAGKRDSREKTQTPDSAFGYRHSSESDNEWDHSPHPLPVSRNPLLCSTDYKTTLLSPLETALEQWDAHLAQTKRHTYTDLELLDSHPPANYLLPHGIQHSFLHESPLMLDSHGLCHLGVCRIQNHPHCSLSIHCSGCLPASASKIATQRHFRFQTMQNRPMNKVWHF